MHIVDFAGEAVAIPREVGGVDVHLFTKSRTANFYEPENRLWRLSARQPCVKGCGAEEPSTGPVEFKRPMASGEGRKSWREADPSTYSRWQHKKWVRHQARVRWEEQVASSVGHRQVKSL